jgi:hypothetical protein
MNMTFHPGFSSENPLSSSSKNKNLIGLLINQRTFHFRKDCSPALETNLHRFSYSARKNSEAIFA